MLFAQGCCTCTDIDAGFPALLGHHCIVATSASFPEYGSHLLPSLDNPSPDRFISLQPGTVLRVAHVEGWENIDASGTLVYADIENGPQHGHRVVIGHVYYLPDLYYHPDSRPERTIIMCFSPEGRSLRPLNAADAGIFYSSDPSRFGGGFLNLAPLPWSQALADAIGAVCNADAKGRIKLLWQDLYSPKSEISGWAASALAEADPTAVRKLAGDVTALQKIPLASQVELDGALSTMEKNWPASPQRYQMMSNWVAEIGDEYESELVVERLSWLADQEHPNLPDSQMLDLLEQLALRDRVSSALHVRAVGAIGSILLSNWAPNRMLNADAVVTLHQIEHESKDPAVLDEVRFLRAWEPQ